MRKRRREREAWEKRKRENKRPILKKLCAALLLSFREQHSEKMKGSARGSWDLQKGQQLFRPNPNGVGDRTITVRWLLIGAVFLYSQLRLTSQSSNAYSSQCSMMTKQFAVSSLVVGRSQNELEKLLTTEKKRIKVVNKMKVMVAVDESTASENAFLCKFYKTCLQNDNDNYQVV